MRTTNARREVTDDGPARGWRYGDAIGRRNSDTRGLTGAGFHVEGEDQPDKREVAEVKEALADAARARRVLRRGVSKV